MFALLFTENTTGFEVQSCLATHASTRISARAEAEKVKMGKGNQRNQPKVNETQGFLT